MPARKPDQERIEQYICHDKLEFLLVFVIKNLPACPPKASSNLMIAFQKVEEHFFAKLLREQSLEFLTN